MTTPSSNSTLPLLDFEPKTDDFLGEALAGLQACPRKIPCKFFYDYKGSKLFNRICELPEYYPTRTELEIMRRYAGEMAEFIGPRGVLVEYGSGSSLKTPLLLERLIDPVGYVPIDISRRHLLDSAQTLAANFSEIDIHPVCADYTRPFALPEFEREVGHYTIYYPGSTIGNFTPERALEFLKNIAAFCGSGGGLLIGVDLRKDPDILHAAYNDAQGVTAAFNLNLLERINRELDGDFDLDAFRHYAFYNIPESRIEMHLVSLKQQRMSLTGHRFEFEKGESILTEYSYKYSLPSFASLAAKAGFSVRQVWTDPDNLFSVQYLEQVA